MLRLTPTHRLAGFRAGFSGRFFLLFAVERFGRRRAVRRPDSPGGVVARSVVLVRPARPASSASSLSAARASAGGACRLYLVRTKVALSSTDPHIHGELTRLW